MKTIINNLKYIALGAVALTAFSCEDDDDNNNAIDNNNSAFDLTVDNADFDSLNAALIRTGLDATLDGAGTFTVFAPTDAAFDDFLMANNFADLDAVPIDVLRNTLLYHVLGTVKTSGDLTTGYEKTLATNTDGDALDFYLSNNTSVEINDFAMVDLNAVDNTVDNGVVHVLNTVLTLPNVVNLVTPNPDFANLEIALAQEGLVSTLENGDDTAAVPSPYTVFAPTNDAFQALIDADPNDGLNDINDVLALNNLSDILLYHVVSGDAIRGEDITDGVVVDPLTTGTFTINTTNGNQITDGSGTVTDIEVTNITATNGVIHSINFVLRPM